MIQKLYDRGYIAAATRRDRQAVLADGDTDIAVSKETPTVLSLDEATERVSEQESTLVSERPLRDDESVRTIETSRGAVTVTDDHPMTSGRTAKSQASSVGSRGWNTTSHTR